MVRPLDGFTMATLASLPVPTTTAESKAPPSPAEPAAGGRAAWIPMPVRAIQSQRVYEQIAEHLRKGAPNGHLRPRPAPPSRRPQGPPGA